MNRPEHSPIGSPGEHLSELHARLMRLHKLLLEDQRAAYEAVHGEVTASADLFRLLLTHQDFAWLRALSGMIAGIDAALDEAEGALGDAELETFLERSRDLLRSDRSGPFETKYRDVLQRSPDVIMAHAAVFKLL
jgi:hypothetical protein